MERNLFVLRTFTVIMAILLAAFNVGMNIYYKPPIILTIILYFFALVSLGLIIAFFIKQKFFNRK